MEKARNRQGQGLSRSARITNQELRTARKRRPLSVFRPEENHGDERILTLPSDSFVSQTSRSSVTKLDTVPAPCLRGFPTCCDWSRRTQPRAGSFAIGSSVKMCPFAKYAGKTSRPVLHAENTSNSMPGFASLQIQQLLLFSKCSVVVPGGLASGFFSRLLWIIYGCLLQSPPSKRENCSV